MFGKRFMGTLVVGCVAAMMFATGCGQGDASGRQAISGTVTFQGKPLDQGTIQIISLDPGKQAISGGMIKDGKFSVTADKGLLPGKYRVRISSPDTGSAGAAPAMPGDPAPVAKERIPPEYSGPESKLEIEITKGGKNHFDLEIK